MNQPPMQKWERERELPLYLAGPYDDRCKVTSDGRPSGPRCHRIWDHAKHGLECAFSRAIDEAVAPGRPARDASLCEHANECPHICPCRPDCYCKTRTCAPPPVYLGRDGEATLDPARRHPQAQDPIGHLVPIDEALVSSMARLDADERVLSAIQRVAGAKPVSLRRTDLESCSRPVFQQEMAWIRGGCAPLDKAASSTDVLVFAGPQPLAAIDEVAVRVEAIMREIAAKPLAVSAMTREAALLAEVTVFVEMNAHRWQGLTLSERDRAVACAVARHLFKPSGQEGT